VVRSFAALPRRLFLDSCTLQVMLKFGEFLFENVPPLPQGPVIVWNRLLADLEALRCILRVNEGAGFEFALSDRSLAEVIEAGDSRYTQWARDVLDVWNITVSTYKDTAFTGQGMAVAAHLDDQRFGYLGAKDRRLLQDAVAMECDAFLTMEYKLPRNADHIESELGLRVLRPPEFWAILRPWAALWA
jgi:hypothetical protein